MNLKLRFSPLSPFVRKVLVFARELGVIDQITLVPTDVWDPNSDIATDNPLGKVPVLLSADGAFPGSLLCCEYLQAQKREPSLIPQAGGERWSVLQLHAVADGVLEAAVAHAVERFRRPKEAVFEGNLSRQETKIRNALGHLENRHAAFADRVDLSSITVACALEYLDLRLSHLNWRSQAPVLTAWQSAFSGRPSLVATRPTT